MRTSRILALAFAGALALSACGGDDDSPEDVAEDIEDAIEDGDIEELEDLEDELEDLGDDDGGGGDLPDPCELVTQEDAQGLFGEGIEAQVDGDASGSVGGGESCIWENVDNEELGTPSHLLQVAAYPGEQYYGDSIYEDEEELDIGDKAFLAPSFALGSVDLQFVKDGTTVTISYSVINIGVEEAEQVEASSKQDEVVALAEQAADRM